MLSLGKLGGGVGKTRGNFYRKEMAMTHGCEVAPGGTAAISVSPMTVDFAQPLHSQGSPLCDCVSPLSVESEPLGTGPSPTGLAGGPGRGCDILSILTYGARKS